jgi:nucleoside-diphosphate-sugar epimerase
MWIVTGGAGFIGSVLVWKLNQEGVDNILVVDRLETSEKWKNLRSRRFLDYLEADTFLSKLIEGKIRKAQGRRHRPLGRLLLHDRNRRFLSCPE